MTTGISVIGCGAKEGRLSGPQPKDASPESAKGTAVNFRYAPLEKTYHYTSVTITNQGTATAHTWELQFSVKVSRNADRYTADTTVEKSLVDGAPAPGIKQSRIAGCKLTTVLDPHGAIVSSKAVGTEGFFNPDARDAGTSFAFPDRALKPGDTWKENREGYTVTFKLVEIQTSDGKRIAKFEERGSDSKGGKVEQPTIILVDADTGVLVDKLAEATIPSGPNANDTLITAHSEIKLRD